MKKPKDEKEVRKEKLAEWEGKGARWCAERLWVAKKEVKEARAQASSAQKAMWRMSAEMDVDYRQVRRANSLMAEVLQKHGITPTKLRLTYVDTDCEHCPCNGAETWNWDCEGCGEEFNGVVYRETEQEYIAEVAFYTYLIEGNALDGITADFEEVQYDLLKAVDVKTGEVIGEWERKVPEEE